jgi:hypothetical protein
MQGKRSRASVFAVALALTAGAACGAGELASAGADRPKSAEVLEARRLLVEIEGFRTETWSWQRLMSIPRTRFANSARVNESLAYRRWVHGLWRQRALVARRQAQHPPRLAAWRCIYRYESAGYGWTVNTGNGFYGGLQMDLEFQRTYAPDLLRKKGTADHWTPLEQMWVAERAYRSGRGFAPWPNTARYCGVL